MIGFLTNDTDTQKMNLYTDLTPFTKINSKWIVHLNVRAKIIKLLEESIGVNPCDLRLHTSFLDMSPKAQTTKEKLDKLGLHQNFKVLCVTEHHQ